MELGHGDCFIVTQCVDSCQIDSAIMTPSNGNIVRVTGPLCGELTGRRWFPLTKVSDAELWRFLGSEPEQTVEQTIVTPAILDDVALIMTPL